MKNAVRCIRSFSLLSIALVAGCEAPQRATAAPPSGANQLVIASPLTTNTNTNTLAAGVPQQHGYEHDPAFLRREILRRQDQRILEATTRAMLEARLVLDDVMPIPYLGLDAEPAPGGMRVTAVYGGTGAHDAGLLVGDLLLSIGGEMTNAPPALAHAIRSRQPGANVELRIVRSGAEKVLSCTVGRRPEEDEDEEEQFPDLPRASATNTGPFAARFDELATDAASPQFDSVLGGHGAPPRWIVAADGDRRALRQASTDRTGIHYPMALAKDFFGGDVKATARMRYVAGDVDRAGGLVLRYHDAGNYYVARVNAAEGDLRIFRVVNGLRRTIGLVKATSADGEWHTLEFSAAGSTLTATLDGAHAAVAHDSYFLKGRAGLWTKSDSVTDFADVTFTPIVK